MSVLLYFARDCLKSLEFWKHATFRAFCFFQLKTSGVPRWPYMKEVCMTASNLRYLLTASKKSPQGQYPEQFSAFGFCRDGIWCCRRSGASSELRKRTLLTFNERRNTLNSPCWINMHQCSWQFRLVTKQDLLLT